MNIFKIGNIEMSVSHGEILRCHSVISAEITNKCNGHGNILFGMKIISEGNGMDNMQALRKAIQTLLYNQGNNEYTVYDSRCCCSPIRDEIIFDFSNLEPQLRDLFESLFKDTNWTIPQKLIPSPNY